VKKPTLILPPEAQAAAKADRLRRAERHNALISDVFTKITSEIEEPIDIFMFLQSLTAGLVRVYVGQDKEAQAEYLGMLMTTVQERLNTMQPSTNDEPKAATQIIVPDVLNSPTTMPIRMLLCCEAWGAREALFEHALVG
jgi:hypothetical protein